MIECWMCPKSPQGECNHEEKYCSKYRRPTGKDSIPNNIKEYEEIRQKEIEYWKKEESKSK